MRLRRRQQAQRGFAAGHKFHLTHGRDYFGGAWGGCLWSHTGAVLEEIQDAWAQFGPEILAECIAQRPGHRPAGWWLLDAPEAIRGPMPSHGDQPAILRRAGVLSDEEEKRLAVVSRVVPPLWRRDDLRQMDE